MRKTIKSLANIVNEVASFPFDIARRSEKLENRVLRTDGSRGGQADLRRGELSSVRTMIADGFVPYRIIARGPNSGESVA